jgi:glycogen debranching enzyme
MRDPLDAEAQSVPSIGRRQLILVAGRTFATSDDDGSMRGGTHGLVHDDVRHLSLFGVRFDGLPIELLSSSARDPLSAVIVGRICPEPDRSVLVIRRRWVASGLREDIHIHNAAAVPWRGTLRVRVGADFAHLFDVKAGHGRTVLGPTPVGTRWRIDSDEPGEWTEIWTRPTADRLDVEQGELVWDLHVGPREELVVSVAVEPFVAGAPAGLAFPLDVVPTDAIPMRQLDTWKARVPDLECTDWRLSRAFESALEDIAALRIVDPGHAERAIVAAGAPWYMTVFGRDSLLTSWMTLPFDPELGRGTLHTLADLQGRQVDPIADEEPGKIIHELRRRGGGGPFASRARYFGSVDATPLFLMLAAEAARWGALGDDLDGLRPALEAALGWLLRTIDSSEDGFVRYQRARPTGLSNQGWKDSWDGVTYADGRVAHPPTALVEVQGYAYAAMLGAAELGVGGDPGSLRLRAARLRTAFNERFWDERGWFVIGLDGSGRPIDSLTTNPGHALWTGIADEDLAHSYLDRLLESRLWTGWGLRTLADDMGAYDPLSYHNGSVWPHDTAVCAAGAARYRRWDVVDRIVDGALDAAMELRGRPPELFAGIAREEAPTPVAYPASCSPQAWASASTLLLVRTMLGVRAEGADVLLDRRDYSSVPDLHLTGVHVGGRRVSIVVEAGSARTRLDSARTG